MRHTSTIRSRQQRIYRRLRADFLRNTMICFKCRQVVFSKHRQLHHFYGRTGRLLTWEPGFRLVCAHCHEWIETHRKQAVKLGLRANERLFGRPSVVIPKGPYIGSEVIWSCR